MTNLEEKYCGLVLMKLGMLEDDLDLTTDFSAFIVDFDRIEDDTHTLSTEDKNGLAKGFYKKLMDCLEVSVVLK